MQILVTGVSGFIARAIADALSDEHEVFGLARREVSPAGWTFVRGDVTEYGRVLEVLADYEIEQIYHCAAKSIVRNCMRDPIGCFRTNAIGTLNILEAARQIGRIKGVLCIESDKAYGAGATPYTETQPLMPTSIYEASKACASHLVQTYHKSYVVPAFSVRPVNVYGPGDRNSSRIVPRTINKLASGLQPTITDGAAHFVREFIYIDDLVETLVALMGRSPWGEVFNVGTGQVLSVQDMIWTICKLMGKSAEVEVQKKPRLLREIPRQSLCIDKLTQWLPHRQQPVALEDGLNKTIEWWAP